MRRRYGIISLLLWFATFMLLAVGGCSSKPAEPPEAVTARFYECWVNNDKSGFLAECQDRKCGEVGYDMCVAIFQLKQAIIKKYGSDGWDQFMNLKGLEGAFFTDVWSKDWNPSQFTYKRLSNTAVEVTVPDGQNLYLVLDGRWLVSTEAVCAMGPYLRRQTPIIQAAISDVENMPPEELRKHLQAQLTELYNKVMGDQK